MGMAACLHRKSWAAGLIEATPTAERLANASRGSGVRGGEMADMRRSQPRRQQMQAGAVDGRGHLR